ncbi:MAG: TIR domain-containing protein [Lachnospiraceae bacterium]|nr:TIR domain-containing protein [Lachnospiraceae bacterium]
MTKDAQKLLRHIIDGAKSQNSATVEIDISKIDNIPNIEFAQKRLLNELEAVGVISGYQANILGEVFVYLTSDGLEYFDDLGKDKKSSSIVFNVSGGQINIANDKGSINAVINDKLSEKDAILESKYKENKEAGLSSNKKIEKVFISYSWTPDCNKKWVEQLVHRLESDGVQVVIDFKDLKLGHDKYAFMERTVNDDTIKKVLIICNRTYKEKADGRIGGVGDESAIITSQIYGNIRQEKFIPVVNEYDENGKPFLPNYLASRMYADLTDFEDGYKQLLNNIGEVDVMDVSTMEKVEDSDIKMFGEPTPFFAHRLGKAFPGVRGIREFTDPIWWFRGGSNLYIKKFTRISSSKFLMNTDEIEVKKIIVYVSPHYFKRFVYVEAYPESSIGVYGDVNQQFVDERVKTCGEYHEEYAVYEGHAITREEFDDGAAEIDGKIIDIIGKAETRVRYLTPYNFIICAKWNPLNENKYDDTIESILNGMLKGVRTIDELVTLVERAPRHKNDI